MLEMRAVGPGEARLLEDGSEVGQARWEIRSLAWPGEEVRVALVEELRAPADCRGDFWAYLTFLFQRQGVAAARLEGTFFWFSQALRKSWEKSGSPTAELE